MQKSTVKINILLVVMMALVAAIVSMVIALGHGAHAEGNDAGSESREDFSIVLDVNGRDSATTDYKDENTEAAILANNERNFRIRYINSAALVAGIYTFDADSIINRSKCFTVAVEAGSQDMNLVITAQSLTEISSGYFSVELINNQNRDERVQKIFKVDVHDTFALATDAGVAITTVKVGLKKGAAGADQIPTNGIMTIDNYSKLTIDLGEYLQDRVLFTENGSRIEDGSNVPWVFNSVTNFLIDPANVVFDISGLTLKNIITTFSSAYDSTVENGAPVRITPTVTGTVEITDRNIQGFEQLENKKFWETQHEIRLTLREINNSSSSYVIILPVSFRPANPQVKTIPTERMRLNVASENVYDMASSGPRPADYSAIKIHPSDIIEYSVPEEGYAEMVFDYGNTLIEGLHIDGSSSDRELPTGCVIKRNETDEAENAPTGNLYPSELIITGSPDGTDTSYNITFAVLYGTADGRRSINVDLSVSTYGGYQVTFPSMNGKGSVSYNRDDDVFAEMRNRGYYITAARSNNQDKLNAEFTNGTLTLTPNVKNITGQTYVTVSLTFTNNNNQSITFDSEEINIDVDANSFFARFEDWQAWLIIAACIIGGIIIILLVVWLFIHSISKHKQDELATQAPVSSYIVKLNNTIAATQAQQRMAQTQALSQASTMLLGAGPAATGAPQPDMLQLATGLASTPSTPSTPMFSEPQAAIPPDGGEDLEALIAKYITDEELLDRIFTEKYEPKGMARRTFFKSKDLQARELDKEKKRIIERYKTPMPMDEAIMSETELKNAEQSSSPLASEPRMSEPQPTVEMFELDFDPDAPLYVETENKDEFVEEKIDMDVSPEEQRLKELEHRNDIFEKELAELASRLSKVQSELARAKSLEEELREKIAKAESDDEQYGKDIEDLEFKLASAKNRDKDRITRDIGIKEEKKKRNLEDLERLRAELDRLLGNVDRLEGISSKLTDTQNQKTAEKQNTDADIEKARAEYNAYMDRLAKVKAKQELEAKVTGLTPLLQAVNSTEYEIRKLDERTSADEKERDSLKGEVAAAKAQILGANDFSVINDLNTRISDANSRLSELEKETSKSTKLKSELNIKFNSERRQANEFIETNDIPLEEVIRAEDVVIGNIELELLKSLREKDKVEAESAVASAHAVYDDLSASSDDLTLIAMDVAASLKDIEDEIEFAQADLDEVNARMESATEDERLMLMVDQGDKADKVEELKAKLEQANIEGTKRKMEAQAEYDAKLEKARADLEEANVEFSKACLVYDELVNNTNPVDLIVSGSGVISRDQKKIEAENLKKQLERSKNEIEQARLAAQQAQEEAEKVRADAERASEEARAEAERVAREAQEAAEKARIEAEEAAEKARLEAEEKARADVEAAEKARAEAEAALAAEAEEARRKAEEESEEAKRKAMEESEEAKRKAQEEAEEAKRIAMEEAEEAKRKAQEEIEEMKRRSEAEAEAKRAEEEAKRAEEEERKKLEAERNETIAKKVSIRKEQIIAIRNDMKELKGDEDAKTLRERLYNIQLTFDEDERGSSDLMDFYNKTMDDIQNSGEIARLKAENAKKPQRVVRKVTERVNRIPKRKPGASGARAGARPGARPASARPGARPAGSRNGARPTSARPGARPGARPAGTRPPARPGARPNGSKPTRPRS